MIDWLTEKNLVEYEDAVLKMEERVAAIREDCGNEAVWMLEHPPLYTAGTSAKEADLIDARFSVYKSGRGGEYTYHGPGQRVAYVLLDLKKRQAGAPDIRGYVRSLEEWIICTLADFGVKGERREGRVGIWVDMAAYGGREGEEAKIAAIGVRIRHWVSYHGVAINLNPDLSHFAGIIPCGISEHGVTSLHALGLKDVDMAALDLALKKNFCLIFSS
jgi:lipoyl(octanoyl) transferase